MSSLDLGNVRSGTGSEEEGRRGEEEWKDEIIVRPEPEDAREALFAGLVARREE